MLWWQAASKLLFFLCFLPFLLTYLHFRVTVHRANLVLVGPAGNERIFSPQEDTIVKRGTNQENSFYGIYRPDTTINGAYRQVAAVSKQQNAGSAAYVSNILAQAATTTFGSVQQEHTISYDSREKQWCLVAATTTEHRVACSAPMISDSASSLQSPPSGTWMLSNSNADSSSLVRVSYMGPDMAESSVQKKNPRRKPNKNAEQIIRRPATTLLLAINILLAFLYWNQRVSPADVAKNYDRIIHHYEYYRAFSGAFAHFEPLHLGFNMMALQSLGAELEGESLFGSVVFVYYNLSLVVVTTVFLMLGWYLQQQQRGGGDATTTNSSSTTNTVGYSGVLFAWMVISSLERESTCPVFFVPDMCFKTYTVWWKLKFNISPLIQLGVAQMIMPRVSFLGHLAGICAGFLLHWNLLPIEYFQPSVLIPATMLVLLWRARKIIPVRRLSNSEEDNHDDEEQHAMNDDNDEATLDAASGRFDARRHKRNRTRSLHRLFVYSHYGMILSTALSFFTIPTLSSLLIAPALCWYLFFSCLQSHALFLRTLSNTERHKNEKQRLGVLLRWFVVACVLFIVCDSMTLASWIVMRNLWGSRWVLASSAVMVLRLIVYTTGLSVACKRLSDVGETGTGIFVNVLQFTVLENARTLGNFLFSFMNKSSQWSAFEGRGVALGGTRLEDEEQGTRQMSSAL